MSVRQRYLQRGTRRSRAQMMTKPQERCPAGEYNNREQIIYCAWYNYVLSPLRGARSAAVYESWPWPWPWARRCCREHRCCTRSECCSTASPQGQLCYSLSPLYSLRRKYLGWIVRAPPLRTQVGRKRQRRSAAADAPSEQETTGWISSGVEWKLQPGGEEERGVRRDGGERSGGERWGGGSGLLSSWFCLICMCVCWSC